MTVLLWTVLGFLAGSLPFSVWLGRLLARADVRAYGEDRKRPRLTSSHRP